MPNEYTKHLTPVYTKDMRIVVLWDWLEVGFDCSGWEGADRDCLSVIVPSARGDLFDDSNDELNVLDGLDRQDLTHRYLTAGQVEWAKAGAEKCGCRDCHSCRVAYVAKVLEARSGV